MHDNEMTLVSQDKSVSAYANLAYTLASQGCNEKTIRQAIGVTPKEWAIMLERDQDLIIMMDQGRAAGVRRVTERLLEMASEGNSVEAIKYYLSLQDKDYRTDRPGVEINQTAVTLPSPYQIRKILEEDPAYDPSLIGADNENKGRDPKDPERLSGEVD